LVSLYTHAWQATKNPLYEKVVHEILEFTEREMTSPEGGFYSSLDADSDGEEGKFYVWTKNEIDEALGGDAKIFNDFYNVTAIGNWEHGKNILLRKETTKKLAGKHKLTEDDLNKLISNGKSVLLKSRSGRIRPGLDDKILTSWNALMLSGYIDAYRAFGDDKYLKAALKNANFLVKQAMNKDGGLTRNYKNGKASIHAFLDDYALVASAFINLYQATFDEKWLNQANQITKYALLHFYDEESGMFFYTHDEHSNLISRKMEVADNVIPSSNSEMSKNLLFLGHYFYEESFVKKASQMIVNVQKSVHNGIYFYSNWGIVEANFVQQPYNVAIVGEDFKSIRQEMDQNYLPNVLFMGGKDEGKLELLEGKLMNGQTTIYVCQDRSCKMPVTTVTDALKQMDR